MNWKTILLFAILLSSCGTRKRAGELQKLEIESLRETISEIQNNIKANVKLTKEANILKLKPIDPTKESTYTDSNGNTTTFNNAEIILDNSISDSTATTLDKSKKNTSETADISVSSKDKKVAAESKKPNPYLWAGLTILAVVIAYLVYRKIAFKV